MVLFFVIEQVPGLSHVEDMSQWLQAKRFWASENRAWFEDVKELIGQTEATELRGDLYSADKNPRHKIFNKNAPLVESLDDMHSIMQRDRWPNEDALAEPDPLFGSMNTPDHAISARNDLDENWPSNFGGTDSKVTNRCLAKLLQVHAISGPTHDHQKPFKWSESPKASAAPHDGQPDEWNFPWVRFSPQGPEMLETDACDE
eukprot:gnl/TRDRNA2_/TRDRNA2_132939_c2_seq1.p1 gnl/TRDRNA2_/TRDRNA2_132939_c2~~gnl/TRDRNA2_/TRDRNA2_132939_c2_seq1.p1  ORF type:complete len:202 (-),score=25.72 gnl/TRDRNA2_/TRDRNA2_132939_c2_seq1:99-704(-)